MAQKLKINAKPTFSAPVVLCLAGDDGKTQEMKFTAIFRRIKGDEADAMQAKLEAKQLPDRELLDSVLAGWDGLEAEDGMPFAFSAENRAAARQDWPTFEAALVLSYFKHHDAALAKN